MKPNKAALIERFVSVEFIETGARWIVGPGDKRQGSRGVAVATIGFRHSRGYEVVLQLDNGKLDSFAPMQLFPECAA